MDTAVAALVVKAKREIQRHFFSADAVRADRAVAFTPSNGFEARQFARLLKQGVIRQEAGDRYWIDIVAYDLAVHRRYNRVRTILMVLVIVVAATLIFRKTTGAA
jgi:hypothetical protein